MSTNPSSLSVSMQGLVSSAINEALENYVRGHASNVALEELIAAIAELEGSTQLLAVAETLRDDVLYVLAEWDSRHDVADLPSAIDAMRKSFYAYDRATADYEAGTWMSPVEGFIRGALWAQRDLPPGMQLHMPAIEAAATGWASAQGVSHG